MRLMRAFAATLAGFVVVFPSQANNKTVGMVEMTLDGGPRPGTWWSRKAKFSPTLRGCQ